MISPNTTQVPNSVFDVYLKELKCAEIKVLLVVIRQTLGWKDKRAILGRKEVDWISNKQLQEKTRSSRRAISSATETLVRKNLIEVLDDGGTILNDPQLRRGKLRLFYRVSSSLYASGDNLGITGEEVSKTTTTSAIFAEDLRKKRTALAQKMRITKETQQN